MKTNFLLEFLVLMAVFAPLEYFFGRSRSKSLLRPGWQTDALFYFVNKLIVVAGLWVVTNFLATKISGLPGSPQSETFISAWPAWIQFLVVWFVSDLGTYWLHRLNHKIPFLWKFHSIHHSPPKLDWLATARFHPLEHVFMKGVQMIPIYFLGFSSEVLTYYVFFAVGHAYITHSQFTLPFGPLKYILVSPEYHHWHHANEPSAYDKNFSAQIPLFDRLFGTYKDPQGKFPKQYGVPEPLPSSYLGLIAYPFIGTREPKDTLASISDPSSRISLPSAGSSE